MGQESTIKERGLWPSAIANTNPAKLNCAAIEAKLLSGCCGNLLANCEEI